MKSENEFWIRGALAAMLLAAGAMSMGGCATPQQHTAKGRNDNLKLVEIRHPWSPSTYAYRRAETGQTFQQQ